MDTSRWRRSQEEHPDSAVMFSVEGGVALAEDGVRLLFFFDILPLLLEYQGNFQSCFHFGDSYRMEQAVDGVHAPGDSHLYASHQHNGFHMPASSTGSAGEGGWRCGPDSLLDGS